MNLYAFANPDGSIVTNGKDTPSLDLARGRNGGNILDFKRSVAATIQRITQVSVTPTADDRATPKHTYTGCFTPRACRRIGDLIPHSSR
jgi:hypothetical protein